MTGARVSWGEIIVDLDAAKRGSAVTLMVQVLAEEDKAINGEASCSA
jgi:hypothetical protein